MKKKNIVFLIVGIVIIITLTILNPFKKDIWDTNAEKLKNSFEGIDRNLLIEDISEYIPFEWDELYSFSPYTSKEEIYKVIGYKWDRISETANESMNQIVFVKDDKVVCYFYGYPENTKLGFNFGVYEGNHIKLTSNQKQPFKLQLQKNGLKFLRYAKEQTDVSVENQDNAQHNNKKVTITGYEMIIVSNGEKEEISLFTYSTVMPGEKSEKFESINNL